MDFQISREIRIPRGVWNPFSVGEIMGHTIFGHELIGRHVVDQDGGSIGELVDIIVELNSGNTTQLVVKLSKDLDPDKLPWKHSNGLIKIPVEQVARVSSSIHLTL